jgi:hypothetical protein
LNFALIKSFDKNVLYEQGFVLLQGCTLFALFNFIVKLTHEILVSGKYGEKYALRMLLETFTSQGSVHVLIVLTSPLFHRYTRIYFN